MGARMEESQRVKWRTVIPGDRNLNVSLGRVKFYHQYQGLAKVCSS